MAQVLKTGFALVSGEYGINNNDIYDNEESNACFWDPSRGYQDVPFG